MDRKQFYAHLSSTLSHSDPICDAEVHQLVSHILSGSADGNEVAKVDPLIDVRQRVAAFLDIKSGWDEGTTEIDSPFELWVTGLLIGGLLAGARLATEYHMRHGVDPIAPDLMRHDDAFLTAVDNKMEEMRDDTGMPPFFYDTIE